jgi:hypothetical protein
LHITHDQQLKQVAASKGYNFAAEK